MKNSYKDSFDGFGCGALIIILIMALALAFGIMCFEAWIAMLIWNYVVVALFATLPIIGFWQMFLILMLINIVFGGLKTVVRTRD
jgi:hypothetical protein